MKIIIANWKSNKNESQALDWLEVVGPKIKKKPDLEISVAPQLFLLGLLNQEIRNKGYHFCLTAQDIGPFDQGPYTGEVAAETLPSLVKYVLIGHSERKKIFGETNHLANLKIKQCLEYQLTPIVCLAGLEEIDEIIKSIKKEDLKKMVFMYEPPAAISKPIGPIGVGEAEPIIKVLEMISKIKKISPKSKIFYGGSVKSNNVKIYLQESEIDGIVVGSASLNPQEFLKIIANASQI